MYLPVVGLVTLPLQVVLVGYLLLLAVLLTSGFVRGAEVVVGQEQRATTVQEVGAEVLPLAALTAQPHTLLKMAVTPIYMVLAKATRLVDEVAVAAQQILTHLRATMQNLAEEVAVVVMMLTMISLVAVRYLVQEVAVEEWTELV